MNHGVRACEEVCQAHEAASVRAWSGESWMSIRTQRAGASGGGGE